MEYISPSKEELLASIKPDMKHLTKGFFKRMYGYEISYPGFADKAITALEAAGCSKARAYYESWVNEYEASHNAGLKEAAHWYVAECEREWKKRQEEGEERRRQNIMQDLHQRSDRELLSLLQTLN